MKATVIIIVLLAVVIIGYMLVSKSKSEESTVLNNQKAMQNKSPQELSIEVFSVLDEPRKLRDDQVHAVDWARVLQLIEAGADVNQRDEDGFSMWNRVVSAPIPNEVGVDVKKELLQRAKIEEELRKRGANVEGPFTGVQDLQFDLRDYQENDEIAPDYPIVMLESAVRSGDVDEVKKWLNEGAAPVDWNWKEAIGKGMQPSQVKPEIVKLLVEAGVDPKDFEGPKSAREEE